MSILKYFDKETKQYKPVSNGTPPQFTSGDSENPTEWTNVAVIQDNEATPSFRQKVSTIVGNVRYLWKFIGNTDISQIGDGTITDAINYVNNHKMSIEGGVLDLDNPPLARSFATGVSPSSGYPSGLGGNSCFVFQNGAGTNYWVQIAFGFGSDKIAIRRKFGSPTWGDWKYLDANLIGTTDISSIADGALTGAISNLDARLKYFNAIHLPSKTTISLDVISALFLIITQRNENTEMVIVDGAISYLHGTQSLVELSLNGTRLDIKNTANWNNLAYCIGWYDNLTTNV